MLLKAYMVYGWLEIQCQLFCRVDWDHLLRFSLYSSDVPLGRGAHIGCSVGGCGALENVERLLEREYEGISGGVRGGRRDEELAGAVSLTSWGLVEEGDAVGRRICR